MRARTSCVLLLVMLLAGVLLPANGRAQSAPQATELRSYDQLIGVLMSEQQLAAWQALRTDAARQQFVDTFWRGLDPTPGTAANELRTVFLRRAERAQAMFGATSNLPGYATDRGRVLMVYGLPDTQELRALPPGTDSPQLVWTYRELSGPNGVRFVGGADGFTLVSPVPLGAEPFRRSAENELRLLLATGVGSSQRVLAYPNPDDDAAEDDESEEDGSEGGDAASVDDEVGEPGDAGVLPSVGVAGASVAPEVRIWMRMVFGGEMREEIGLRHRVDFFPAVEGTYTVLSFQVRKEGLTFVGSGAAGSGDAQTDDEGDDEGRAESEPESEAETEVQGEAEAGVEGEGGAESPSERDAGVPSVPGPLSTAQLTAFGAVLQGEPGKEDTIHQFIVPFTLRGGTPDATESVLRSIGVTLLPGSYRLAWGLYEAAGDLAVTRDVAFVVPDFAAPGLRLSSTIIARPPHGSYSLPMSTDKVYEGLRLGNVQLLDDLDRELERDETIEVVTIVSGWRSDPAAPGTPKLEVEYRLLDGDVSIVRLPTQELDFHVLGQQIPLAQVDQIVAGGTYLLQMRIKDLVSGDAIVSTTPLRIAAR